MFNDAVIKLRSVSGKIIGEKGLVRMKKEEVVAFVFSLMKPAKFLSRVTVPTNVSVIHHPNKSEALLLEPTW